MTALRREVVDVLLSEGAGPGMRMLKARGAISPVEEKAILHKTYQAILVEVEEARRELTRIQMSLNALASAAQAGIRSPTGPGGDATFIQMTNHLITFDAWVASLLETDLTITGLLNPKHTRGKIAELAKAMNALMDKRAAEQHPVLDDPNLFRGYVDR